MPVASTFAACLAFVLGPDRDGHGDDSAPGEGFLTRWGVTHPTWDMAEHQGIVSGSLADATRAQCAAVLRALYWNVLHCSALGPGVNLMAFNAGMLAGTGHAARLIQRIVGAGVDGVIGPLTIHACDGFGDQALIDAIAAGDEAYYAALATADLFLRGWTLREQAARALAYQMAGLPASAA